MDNLASSHDRLKADLHAVTQRSDRLSVDVKQLLGSVGGISMLSRELVADMKGLREEVKACERNACRRHRTCKRTLFRAASSLRVSIRASRRKSRLCKVQRNTHLELHHHVCTTCGLRYAHTHSNPMVDHGQEKVCPNSSCPLFYGHSDQSSHNPFLARLENYHALLQGVKDAPLLSPKLYHEPTDQLATMVRSEKYTVELPGYDRRLVRASQTSGAASSEGMLTVDPWVQPLVEGLVNRLGSAMLLWCQRFGIE
eukprot:1096148-Amphidinium_carterae.2